MTGRTHIEIKRALTLGAAAAAVAAQAFAQDEADDGTQDEVVDEIVVTTERREQSLQDVPAVAKVLTAEELRQRGINDFTDLQSAIPQLNIGNREGNVEVFIRGIGDDNNTELSEPRSAILYDGIYLSRPRGLGSFFYDLQTVEVNIGPQGTLRGRNATGGSLNIVTAKPQIGVFGGYVDAGVGNFSTTEVQGALNIPLTDNSALRIAGYSLENDAKILAIGPRSDSIEESRATHDRSGRLSFLWEPTDALTVELGGDYLHSEGTGYGGLDYFPFFQEQFNGNLPDQQVSDLDDPWRIVSQGRQPQQDQIIWGLRGQAAYDFGAMTAEYIGGYRDVDYFFTRTSSSDAYFPGFEELIIGTSSLPPDFVVGDVDAYFDTYSPIQFDQDFQSQSHEVRLFANDDQRFRWTLGGFYFRETGESYFNTAADRGFVFAGVEFAFPKVERENYAVYGDATYDVTDDLRLTGGLRFTTEELAREGFGATWLFLFPNDTSGAAPDTFNFSCCAPHRFGTSGFQWLGRDRTVGVNDVDITTPEGRIELFLSGIEDFGTQDTIRNQLQLLLNEGPNQSGFGLDGREISAIVPNDADRSDDFIDWRARVEYDVTEDNLVYGSVSTGHNSGGFNDTFRNTDGSLIAPEFEEESVIVYEVGSKNVFDLGGYRSVFNLAGFFYDYKDQQFTVLSPLPAVPNPNADPNAPEPAPTLVSLRQNVGDSEILGFDLDYTQFLPANLKARLNVQFLDTEFTSSEVPLIDTRIDAAGEGDVPLPSVPFDPVGNRLPKASEWSGLFSLEQAIDTDIGRFDWIASLGFRSDYFLTIFNGGGELPAAADFPGLFDSEFAGREGLFDANVASNAGALRDKVDGYVRLDLGAGFSPAGYEQVRIEAYAKNVTNEAYSQTSLNAPGLNLRFINDPRTYGARVRVSF